MGIAIGTHDETSGRMKYLRDDSRPDMLWSTLDPDRAKVWHTAEAAQAWAYSLPDDSYKRMFAQRRVFVEVAKEPEGWESPYDLDDPLDSESIAAVEYLDCVAAAEREQQRQEQKGKS